MQIDLTGFDFSNIQKVILTIKNVPEVSSSKLIVREYDSPTVYNENITPEESLSLKTGAVYDFTIVDIEGRRYKNGENGKVVLRKGVGDCV